MAGLSGWRRIAQLLGRRWRLWWDWSPASTWLSWPRYLQCWGWQTFFAEERWRDTQQQVLTSSNIYKQHCHCHWTRHNLTNCSPSSFFLMSSLAGVSSDWRYFRWSWSIFSQSSEVRFSLIFMLVLAGLALLRLFSTTWRWMWSSVTRHLLLTN